MSRGAVKHVVVLPDGVRRKVPDPPAAPTKPAGPLPATHPGAPSGPTRPAPLGRVCGARSGDKGCDANIGLWARDATGYAWLSEYLTVERVRELLGPEVADLKIDRFNLPNLRAINVVVHGLLGDGVASCTRPDPQAKGLGEYLRSRVVDIPEALLGG